MSDSVRAAVTTPSILGECPVWSPAEGVLYWLDIEGRVVHRYEPATGIDSTRGTPGRPGAVFLTRTPGS